MGVLHELLLLGSRGDCDTVNPSEVGVTSRDFVQAGFAAQFDHLTNPLFSSQPPSTVYRDQRQSVQQRQDGSQLRQNVRDALGACFRVAFRKLDRETGRQWKVGHAEVALVSIPLTVSLCR